MKNAIILSLIIVVVLTLFGEIRTFTGAEDNRWSNPNNWDPRGVPGADDHADIPEDKECHIDIHSVDVTGIENDGTLTFNKSCVVTSDGVDNNGYIRGEGNAVFNQKNDGEVFVFNNWGSIEMPNSTFIVLGKDNEHLGGSEFYQRSGYVNVNYCYINVKNIRNSSGSINGNYVSFSAKQELDNHGGINGRSYHDDTDGGSIKIECGGEFIGAGVYGGNSGSGFGGSVDIRANKMRSYFSDDRIASGDGGTDGKVNVYAGSVKGNIKIDGGKIVETLDEDDDRFAPISIFADSIYIAPDSGARIRTDSLLIVGRYIDIDFDTTGQMVAFDEIEIFSTEEGHIDMSDVAGVGTISSDEIDVYSDDIRTPPGGFLLSCMPSPDLHSFHNDLTRFVATPSDIAVFEGDTVAYCIGIMNASTDTHDLNVTVESSRRWFDMRASILDIEPLAFDSICLEFVVPDPDDSLLYIDTLSIVLSGDGGTWNYESYIFLQTFPTVEPREPFDVEFEEGWNMVGFPFLGPAVAPEDLGFVETPAYSWSTDSAAYFETERVLEGVGAWFRATTDTTHTFVADELAESVTLPFHRGWNLISGPSHVVELAHILDAYPAIVEPVYGYDAITNRYVTVDALQPGHSYWVLSQAETDVLLD